MSVTIRSATTADHGVIADLLSSAYADFAALSPDYFDHVRDPANWADDASEVFVAVEDGGEVVGVVAMAVEGTPLHEHVEPPIGDAGFRFLAVDEQARGQGVGAALVRACLERATDMGHRRVGIYTMGFMRAAHRLYDRLGFDRREDLDVVFDGGPGRVYTRDLTPDAAAHFPAPGPVPEPLPRFEDVVADPPPDPRPRC